MKNKFKIEIRTNSEEVIKKIFLDLAKVFDKHGATLIPLNKDTKKLLKDNSK